MQIVGVSQCPGLHLFVFTSIEKKQEDSNILEQQTINEEEEHKILASEYTKRQEKRIRREIEENEFEGAQALLQDIERRRGKQEKKQVVEGLWTIDLYV